VIGFLVFSVKRAFQGFWRNRVMSLAATVTMTLMLVLMAGLLLVLSGLQAGLQFVEQKVEIVAYLNDGVPRERVEALQAEVESLPEVATVTFVSKEEALADYREKLRQQGREDLFDVVGFNPLPASLNVKLRDPRIAGDVVDRLTAPRGVVDRITEPKKVTDAIVAITGVLRTVGAAIILIVGVTVLFIIVNTIRMAVMARADEIEIMRLVGASDAFIRWPFILEGLLVGVLGALVTLGLFALASQPISQAMNQIVTQVPVGFDLELARQLVAIVLGAGVILGGFGSWLSVRTYLIK
jgi:cell division transport system permease protein